jgi:hypothetical protein
MVISVIWETSFSPASRHHLKTSWFRVGRLLPGCAIQNVLHQAPADASVLCCRIDGNRPDAEDDNLTSINSTLPATCTIVRPTVEGPTSSGFP